MTTFVLDASVAAKWFLPAREEPLSGEAFRLLEAFTEGHVRFLVPELFWSEFGNILCKAVRRNRVTQPVAEEAIRRISSLEFPSKSDQSLLSDAYYIASRYGSAVYDSIYVALAIASDAAMVTADERLVNTLPGHMPVLWLGDLRPATA